MVQYGFVIMDLWDMFKDFIEFAFDKLEVILVLIILLMLFPFVKGIGAIFSVSMKTLSKFLPIVFLLIAVEFIFHLDFGIITITKIFASSLIELFKFIFDFIGRYLGG